MLQAAEAIEISFCSFYYLYTFDLARPNVFPGLQKYGYSINPARIRGIIYGKRGNLFTIILNCR
jgi:hypothetical protein